MAFQINWIFVISCKINNILRNVYFGHVDTYMHVNKAIESMGLSFKWTVQTYDLYGVS